MICGNAKVWESQEFILRTPFKEAHAIRSENHRQPLASMPLGSITAFMERSQSPQRLPTND